LSIDIIILNIIVINKRIFIIFLVILQEIQKKMYHKIIAIIITFLVILFPFQMVKADDDHRLETLLIHAYIHEDGSATITEYRHAFLYEGTENYDVIENLGESEILDFVVVENNQPFEPKSNWNINASREEKTNRHGLLKTDDGYELVWGIGEYGEHEYYLQYKVTNFIKQLQDKQILFWRFVNDELNIPPKQIQIEIETDRPLTNENEKIWAFGFEGNVHFVNGLVIAKNEQPLTEDNYATVLIQFPNGTYETNDKIDKTFEEIQEEAFEGSDYGKRNDNLSPQAKVIIIIFLVLFLPAFGIGFSILICQSYRKNRKVKKRIKRYKNQYFRDLPYNGDMIGIFYFLQKRHLANFNHLIEAFLLKWIWQGRAHLEMKQLDGVFKKEEAELYLNEELTTKFDSEYEETLFNILLEVTNGAPLKNSTSAWSETQQKKYKEWKKELSEYSRDLMLEKGYLYKELRRTLSRDIDLYRLTEKGEPIQAEVYKFINYLQDFSLIHEREAINVKLWDELLIWATLLSLAPEVRKQLKKLYPEYEQESSFSGQTIDEIKKLSTTINYYHNYNNYGLGEVANMGGGGSSSIGGGGGSFGGGSGGGTR